MPRHPRVNKWPKYALFDFNNGSVETGLSSMIDMECADDTTDENLSNKCSNWQPTESNENGLGEEAMTKLNGSHQVLLNDNSDRH